jgi:hypothetical protein
MHATDLIRVCKAVLEDTVAKDRAVTTRVVGSILFRLTSTHRCLSKEDRERFGIPKPKRPKAMRCKLLKSERVGDVWLIDVGDPEGDWRFAVEEGSNVSYPVIHQFRAPGEKSWGDTPRGDSLPDRVLNLARRVVEKGEVP